MEMQHRINELINQVSGSAAQFADEIGIQRSSVSHLISGRNKPSTDFFQKLLKVYPSINIRWILTGEGKMFTESNSQQPKNLFTEVKETTSVPVLPNIKQEVINKPQEQVNSVVSDDLSSVVNKINGKKIERIVIFYTDKTFTEYIAESNQ